jgi:predicted GTPase
MVVKTASLVTTDSPNAIRGRRVLVVEDGPTLTHGGMSTGAGYQAASSNGAAEIVDPRPYAQGELDAIYRRFPHLGPILPALGYYPADMVVSATPSSLTELIHVDKPVVKVSYEIRETGEPSLSRIVQDFAKARGLV